MIRTIHQLTLSMCLVFVCLCLSVPIVEAGSTDEIRVVYHIDDARVGRFALHIAKDQLETNPRMKIAMVTYAAGVDFLLKGATDRNDKPYAPDVQALQELGVQFKVCSATLGFRDIPKDRVLDGMEYVPAGTYEVIRLQAEEGYVYLKP